MAKDNGGIVYVLVPRDKVEDNHLPPKLLSVIRKYAPGHELRGKTSARFKGHYGVEVDIVPGIRKDFEIACFQTGVCDGVLSRDEFL